MKRKILYLTSLFCLAACGFIASPSGTSSISPEAQNIPISASPTTETVQEAPRFQNKFFYQFEDQELTPTKAPILETLARLARLPDGDVITLSHHDLRPDETHPLRITALIMTRLSPQNEVRWSKAFSSRYFNLSNLVVFQGDLFLLGSFYPERSQNPHFRNPLKAGEAFSLALIRLSPEGEVLKKYEIPIAPYAAGNAYKRARLYVLDTHELGIVTEQSLLIWRDEKIVQTAAVSPTALLKTPDGEYLGATGKNALHVFKLDHKLQALWSKIWGGNIKGISSISDLHPAESGEYFVSVGINDLTNSTSYGQLNVVFTDQGELKNVKAYNALVNKRPTSFVEVFASFRQGNHIYVSSNHVGSSGARFTAAYDLKGESLFSTAIPPFEKGGIAFDASHWAAVDNNVVLTRNSTAYSFQIDAGSLPMPPQERIQMHENAKFKGLDELSQALQMGEAPVAEVQSGERISFDPLAIALKQME